MKATINIDYQRAGHVQIGTRFVPQSAAATPMGQRLSHFLEGLPSALGDTQDADEDPAGQDQTPAEAPEPTVPLAEHERLVEQYDRLQAQKDELSRQLIDQEKELTGYRIKQARADERAQLAGVSTDAKPKVEEKADDKAQPPADDKAHKETKEAKHEKHDKDKAAQTAHK